MVMEPGSCSCSKSNFSFAFNDIRFSNRVLRIEIMADPSDWARQCKEVPDLTADQQLSSGNQPDMDDAELYQNQDQDQETSVIPSGDQAANSTLDCPAATIISVKTLHISSAILAAKSPFFYKLFTNGMSESKQTHITLRINASEEAGLMELLRFMHSNTLNITTAPALLDVVLAADKFDVSSCMKYLLNSPMTSESALLYLELPHTVDAAQPLIDAAKQYLVDRYNYITKKVFAFDLISVAS